MTSHLNPTEIPSSPGRRYTPVCTLSKFGKVAGDGVAIAAEHVDALGEPVTPGGSYAKPAHLNAERLLLGGGRNGAVARFT